MTLSKIGSKDSPTITGPETFTRNNPDSPTFAVWTGNNRFYAIEIATDYSLFNKKAYGSRRRADNFYASWPEGLLDGQDHPIYRVPVLAWRAMRQARDLFYRIVTSAAKSEWVNVQTSLPVSRLAQAPSIHLIGQFTHVPEVFYRHEELLWRRKPDL